jgi:hypothetical protein
MWRAGGMVQEFTDEHLMVILDDEFGEDWDPEFVAQHSSHEKPHGQIKLLWSNLLGLTLVEENMQSDPRSIQLVVAGASPGTHMPVLLKHLRSSEDGCGGWRDKRSLQICFYDPKALDQTLQKNVDLAKENMKFEQRCFTDKDANTWRQWRERHKADTVLVFFSDIRSDIHGKHEHMRADEEKIAENMEDQKRWVEIMRPDYCMLKFHAPHATPDQPHVDRSLRYLHGQLYEQAFVGLFSAEFRLFCRLPAQAMLKHGPAPYDTTKIERHAMWHTRRRRPQTFSVNGVHLPYDDAFAAHVAHKAQELGLIVNAHTLLAEARGIGHVAHMHFSWPAAQSSRLQAMQLRMLQIL